MGSQMNVSPIPGERLRFMVDSRSRPGMAHMVDLEEYQCNGSCTCEWFLTGLGVSAKAEQHRFASDTVSQCPHIRAAIRYFLRRFTKQRMAQILIRAESKLNMDGRTAVNRVPRTNGRRMRKSRQHKYLTHIPK